MFLTVAQGNIVVLSNGQRQNQQCNPLMYSSIKLFTDSKTSVYVSLTHQMP